RASLRARKDVVDFGEYRRWKLKGKRLEIAAELVRIGGTGNHRAHTRPREQPGDGDGSARRAEIVCDLSEAADALDQLRAIPVLALRGEPCEPAAFGNSVIVLARQQTRRERSLARPPHPLLHSTSPSILFTPPA